MLPNLHRELTEDCHGHRKIVSSRPLHYRKRPCLIKTKYEAQKVSQWLWTPTALRKTGVWFSAPTFTLGRSQLPVPSSFRGLYPPLFISVSTVCMWCTYKEAGMYTYKWFKNRRYKITLFVQYFREYWKEGAFLLRAHPLIWEVRWSVPLSFLGLLSELEIFMQ